ncbi:hypothetical protein ACFFV7_03310 [Nonomuraea spiralis]|uniref:Uncharacterized protein n=1 Tax=Nonomuraea spiralis TaxID=46182 RepID=A0ABV5I6Q3_9ACTN|nr:hypothetical protein [Nonomuraea spiralis]GGS66660.1 hypothetical protein GCM10010176_006630 [Nonomuraea spiralis]
MSDNHGIHISGHAHVRADAMAAGPHAQAHSHKIEDHRRFGDVRTRLDALLADLRADVERHPELRKAIEAAEEVGRELDGGEPEPGRVLRFLGVLGSGVERFSAFAAAAASIEESVRALLP